MSLLLLNTSIANKVNPSKQHWFTRFWLDKSYICNETLCIIQFLKISQTAKKMWKFWKFKICNRHYNCCPFVCVRLLEATIYSWSGKGALKIYAKSLKIYLKEFAFFVKLEARNLKHNLIMDSFWGVSQRCFLNFNWLFMTVLGPKKSVFLEHF